VGVWIGSGPFGRLEDSEEIVSYQFPEADLVLGRGEAVLPLAAFDLESNFVRGRPRRFGLEVGMFSRARIAWAIQSR
jgi:hypothetical protein